MTYRVKGQNVCLVGVSWFVLLVGLFSDSDVVGVGGWYSVVVEGWSSGFLVGVVLVCVGQGVDFGELVLAEIALPGDFYGVVR